MNYTTALAKFAQGNSLCCPLLEDGVAWNSANGHCYAIDAGNTTLCPGGLTTTQSQNGVLNATYVFVDANTSSPSSGVFCPSWSVTTATTQWPPIINETMCGGPALPSPSTQQACPVVAPETAAPTPAPLQCQMSSKVLSVTAPNYAYVTDEPHL